MKYFLDTNICIFFMERNNAAIAKKLWLIPASEIALPSMTVAELWFGALNSARREHNLTKYELFIAQYDCYGFDKAAAEIHGRIREGLKRKGSLIGFNDMIIASTVIANNGVLVTNNTNEFSRIPGLHIEDWSV